LNFLATLAASAGQKMLDQRNEDMHKTYNLILYVKWHSQNMSLCRINKLL
jgi:hypothetical protein